MNLVNYLENGVWSDPPEQQPRQMENEKTWASWPEFYQVRVLTSLVLSIRGHPCPTNRPF